MAFPTTNLLDVFTGTNGVDLPVYSSKWTAVTGATTCEIQGNSAAGTNALGESANYWNVSNFGPDSEVYITITTKPANADRIDIRLRTQGEGDVSTVDGYLLRMATSAGTDSITIRRIDDGSSTILGAALDQEISNGDALGLQMIGSTLQAYLKPSSSGLWSELGTTRTDSTYPAAGKLFLDVLGTAGRNDDFGGGTVVTSLTDNLISFWELEEATNATRMDSVVSSGNSLTSNAGVTQQVGIVGNAAGFALASSQYLSRTSNSTLQFGNKDWTVCAWAYLNSLPGSDMQVVSKQQSGAGEYSMVWKTGSSIFLLDVKAGSGTYVVSCPSSVVVTTATWYMVVTYFTAATGIGSISVNDGVVDTAAKTGNPGVDSTRFTIGARAAPNEFWNGRIDQVGKWNRVLTAAEITYLYNGGAGRSYAEISGGGPIDGGLTSIEQKDIAAFSGAKTFFGTIDALERLDTAAFAGTMIPKFVTGNIAAIEVKDAARFLGDTFTPGIDGGIGATEQRDIAAFSGAKTYFGSIAATEFRDAAAFSGTMIPKFVTGTLAVTEVKDVARVAGDTTHPGAVDGGLSATEQRDTAAFAGAKTYFGTIGAVEGIDLATFNGTAFRLSNGSLAVIEFKDTAAFRGDVFAPGTVLGDVHPVEQRDIASFAGAKTYFGTIGVIEAQDRAAFSGTMIPKFVSGSIGAVEQKDIAYFDGNPPEDTVANDIAIRDANTGIGCSPQTKWKDGAPVGWDGTNVPTAIGLTPGLGNFQNIGGVDRQCRLLQSISIVPAGSDILPGWFSYVDVVAGEWVWCVNRTVIAADMDNPIGFGSI